MIRISKNNHLGKMHSLCTLCSYLAPVLKELCFLFPILKLTTRGWWRCFDSSSEFSHVVCFHSSMVDSIFNMKLFIATCLSNWRQDVFWSGVVLCFPVNRSSPAQLKLHINIGMFQEVYNSHLPCPAQVTHFLFKVWTPDKPETR